LEPVIEVVSMAVRVALLVLVEVRVTELVGMALPVAELVLDAVTVLGAEFDPVWVCVIAAVTAALDVCDTVFVEEALVELVIVLVDE